jgi:hypothetical protein
VRVGAVAGTPQPLLQCRLKVLEDGWVQLHLDVQPGPMAQCSRQGMQQQAGADGVTPCHRPNMQQEEMGADVSSSSAKELYGEQDSSSSGGHSPAGHVPPLPEALTAMEGGGAAAAAAAATLQTTAPHGVCKVLIKRVVLRTQALVPASPYELKVGSTASARVCFYRAAC